MQTVKSEITEAEYKRYASTPYGEWRKEVEATIPDHWRYGYGWYGCAPMEKDGKFYLVHTIGSSCD